MKRYTITYWMADKPNCYDCIFGTSDSEGSRCKIVGKHVRSPMDCECMHLWKEGEQEDEKAGFIR